MTLTVRQVAEQLGVGQHTVLAWISNGELRALNVARDLASQRPQWRITESALAEFHERRQSSPPPLKTSRRRGRQTAAGEVQFYG